MFDRGSFKTFAKNLSLGHWKWGVQRGKSALKTRDSRELKEGKNGDKALLEEYHPAVSVAERE